MHVVHLYDGHERVYEGRGSVPNVVWNVARETAAKGHEVTVVERQWDGLPPRATHDGVDFRRLSLATGADDPWERVPYEMVTSVAGSLRLLGDRTNFALDALRTLRTLSFDVLHVHLPFAANVLVTVAPWLRDRTVYTAHLGELRLNALETDGGTARDDDGDVHVPSLLDHVSPDIYLARRAARTTVLNPDIERQFRQRGVADESVRVVPNGVDVERFTDPDPERVAAVRERYAPDADRVVLFVGTVMPRKGVLELVRAIGEVDGTADLRVLLAGEAGLDDAYTEQVRETVVGEGLTDTVDLLGFVDADELPALYACADAFVVPSLEEGFGMTVIEALAAGTPVVGTRVGGIPELLDGAPGRVVDPDDPDGLADALDTVLDTATTETGVQARARDRASDFAWAGIASQFVDVYGEVAP